ncbi:MAG: hypothetical protein US81_C0039G0001, partial [Parcubacteria group bacterium GW2011_GWE2_38_18]
QSIGVRIPVPEHKNKIHLSESDGVFYFYFQEKG